MGMKEEVKGRGGGLGMEKEGVEKREGGRSNRERREELNEETEEEEEGLGCPLTNLAVAGSLCDITGG